MSRPDVTPRPTSTPTRWLERLKEVPDSTMTVIFVTLTVAAALVSLGLGIREARRTLPVAMGEEQVSREGGETVVSVNVKNRSDEAVCPEIRIAARDREGLDLDEVAAHPRSGEPRIEVDRSRLYVGTFTELTEQQLEEELDEFTAYLVDEDATCEAGEARDGGDGGDAGGPGDGGEVVEAVGAAGAAEGGRFARVGEVT